jgi:multidrug efflux pump subunit AcrA (membrane-fusion protein)
MPDRYGEHDEPIVDLDSRRQARENQAAVERAQAQRERLAETRQVHAPLTNDQAAAARTHRHAITDHAESRRNTLRIANCTLCNNDGYRGATPCDHVDRSATVRRGMAKVRAALNRQTDPNPVSGTTAPERH